MSNEMNLIFKVCRFHVLFLVPSSQLKNIKDYMELFLKKQTNTVYLIKALYALF